VELAGVRVQCFWRPEMSNGQPGG